MEEKTRELSLGESRVRVNLNAAEYSLEDYFKIESAKLIDKLQTVRNDEASKTYDKSPEAFKALSGEKIRLIALAQTAYEEAAMWAEKALTI